MGGLFGLLYATVVLGFLLLVPHELIHGLTAIVVGFSDKIIPLPLI